MKITGKKKGVSPIIATLLLVAIAVAAALIVYAFVTGLIGGLTTTGQSSLVQVTGTITVPSGTGLGTLVLNIKNGASSPITSVTVASDPANQAISFTQAGIAYGPGQPFTVYSSVQGLAIGQSTGASATVGPGGGSLTAGSTYTFTVDVVFANGVSSQLTDISTTAQV